MMKLTINGVRYSTDGMIDLDCSSLQNHGVNMESAYYGPRSHRILIEWYSVWATTNGRCRGQYWTVHAPADSGYGRIVEMLESEGADFPADIPVKTVTE